MKTEIRRTTGHRPIIALMLLCLTGAIGCSHSYDVRYQPGMPRLEHTEKLGGVRLGIATFEDLRPGVDPNDRKTSSYVGAVGVWRKFALSYKGKDFVPVADVVQSLLVEEFNRAGIATIAIPQVLGMGA